MTEERISIDVPLGPVDAVSGLWRAPERDRGIAVLLAHGAGAGMEHPWMARVAADLVGLGCAVLRFDYPYTERARREGKRRPPDRRPVLEAAHRAALEALLERAGPRRAVLAGKSMGSRVGSYLAAAGAPVAGLVHFGYPLHPAGKPDSLRTEQFPAIAQPSLFLSGTRDALCTLPLLEEALETHGGPARLVPVEGGDHSFAVTKSRGGDGGPAYERLAAAVDAWLAEVLGADPTSQSST